MTVDLWDVIQFVLVCCVLCVLVSIANNRRDKW
jgi:hypothetical protein